MLVELDDEEDKLLRSHCLRVLRKDSERPMNPISMMLERTVIEEDVIHNEEVEFDRCEIADYLIQDAMKSEQALAK